MFIDCPNLVTLPKMIYCSDDRKFVEKEFIRMGFNQDAKWRISDVNKDFELCNTYPRFLIIPSNFRDEDLESVAKFRYFRRIPTAVWRHIKNGCFIVRSSQPTVGWFGWFRNDLDESLVQQFVNNNIPPNSEGKMDDNDCEKKQQRCIKDNDDDSCDPKIEPDHLLNNSGSSNSSTSSRISNGSSTSSSRNHERVPQSNTTSVSNILLDAASDNDTSPLKPDNNDARINADNNSQNTTQGNIANEQQQQRQLNQHQQNNGHSPNGKPATDASNGGDQVMTKKASEDCSDKKISTSVPLSNQPSNGITTNGNGTTQPTDSNATTSAPASPSTDIQMLIIDARSYAAAMANRAKGGGCECSEYYQKCEVHFMNLANIHSIRKSYHAIRGVCEAYSEQSNNWLTFLDNSRWLHHISGLLKSALDVVEAIDIKKRSILIHCSDGWDRTPQLVALAEIMLDPHYRTFDGFRTLIQREWLDFGHKFADRCGSDPCNDDPNERCPVFLQWLDCVQQLLVQYPNHFEFNSLYLDKLNRHTYSNVFGTFSLNSTQERLVNRVDERLPSLWSYFDSTKSRYRNEKYIKSDDVLRPSYKVRDLYFWKEVYIPPIRNQAQNIPVAPSSVEGKKYCDSLYIDGLTRTICK